MALGFAKGCRVRMGRVTRARGSPGMGIERDRRSSRGTSGTRRPRPGRHSKVWQGVSYFASSVIGQMLPEKIRISPSSRVSAPSSSARAVLCPVSPGTREVIRGSACSRSSVGVDDAIVIPSAAKRSCRPCRRSIPALARRPRDPACHHRDDERPGST
jgi:hypothetical protein